MSLLKNLLAKFSSDDTSYDDTKTDMSDEARALFDTYLKEAETVNANNFADLEVEAGKKIANCAPELQIAILKEALLQHSALRRSYSTHVALAHIEKLLMRKALPYTEEDLLTIFVFSTRSRANHWFQPSFALLAAMAERHLTANVFSDDLKNALQTCLDFLVKKKQTDAESRKLVRRFNTLINGDDPDGLPFEINGLEAWGARAIKDIKAMPDSEQLAWKQLLDDAIKCSGTTPSKKWMDSTVKQLDTVGKENFVNHIEGWFSLVGTRGTNPEGEDIDPYSIDPNETLTSESADILKGLAWMCSNLDDVRLAQALGDAAEKCFKKVVNLGPRCPKLGNACVGALSNMTSKEAIAQLGRLKARVKHASTRATIEKALNNAANKAGMSVQDLEELNVPDHGFQQIGKLDFDFGTHRAEISISGTDVDLRWYDGAGKEQKSVPAKVKQDHADELKTLKKIPADVEKLILSIRHRIETSLMEQRSWKFNDLKERYLNHPIAATVARRLIWCINGKAAIYHNDEMIDCHSCSVAAPDDAHVELWHPIASEPDEVLAWRQWLRGHEITQPFKQAHREIYVLTDAERGTGTYSNRFAAHVLRQHQLNQLCMQRGWKYTLQGAWDSFNTPFLELPKWDLVAQFFVEGIPDSVSEHSGIYMNCVTDQVRFHRTIGGAPLALTEIMPIVFTEVMRDVDLFVGVCSIGNDPNWVDAGDAHHTYWHDFSFGNLSATSETRKEVLKEILPALKINSRCQIEGRFLVVRGDMRTYKIHLGSANILMEPNDEYLCIVQERGTRDGASSKVFLPFEGDGVLSIILSKAFMLADDTKIKDPSIVSQIKRSGIVQQR